VPWLAVALCLNDPALADSPPPDTSVRASRIAAGDSSSEYWDLAASFDSGHRLLARFLITNEGPGDRTAVAVGHLIHPDGEITPFRNGRRQGRWTLSQDGLHIRIGSSSLDQRGPVQRFEVDNDKRGVKLRLDFRSNGLVSRPEVAKPPGYRFDLLDAAAPVEASLWVRGMDAPVRALGRVAVTHTWMEAGEAELVLRRVEFFSLAGEAPLYLSEVTTPTGERWRWLVVERDARPLHRSERFELDWLADTAEGSAGDYPVPGGLRIRAAGVVGEIRLGPARVRYDPLDDLPQPFRFLLSLTSRPQRVWANSPFEVSVRDRLLEHPQLRVQGSGITAVTYLNPLPASMPVTSAPPTGA
jgi:hypothetical protein